MRYLLDTHTLLWMRANDPRFSREKWETRLFGSENEILVSIVSIWEITIKRSLGKLTLNVPLEDFVGTLISNKNFHILPVEIHHLTQLERLPYHHRDPFDRLLIAQAIETKATAVTEDRHWHQYPVTTDW